MAQGKMAKKDHSRWFNTTVGEFVEAVYEAALEEYMDEIMARRIAMQMLLRKLRLQHKMSDVVESKTPVQGQKKAHLKNEIKKRREKR